MTILQIVNSIKRRTHTDDNTFTPADMLIDINAGYERVNTLIRKWVDNYRPTLFTASDVTTGTATPVFDSLFHDLIPLYVSRDRAGEMLLPNANFFISEIQRLEKELEEWYGMRNYQTFTVTIASPGVITSDGHGLQTNDKITLITTGAFPTGLSADTYYYVISLDTNTFKLSATRDGSAINTTGTQSGTHYYATNKAKGMTTSYNSNTSGSGVIGNGGTDSNR